jgi:hypothetical protein
MGNLIKSFAETGDVASTQVADNFLGGSATINNSKNPLTCDPKKTKEIRNKYEEMIKNARKLGSNVAADNLQHFIDGSGNKRVLSVDWLRSFDSIIDAESRILIYTKEKNIKKWVNEVKNNETINKTDYWDADITNYNPLSELSYASGASDMKGSVNITISKNASFVNFSGWVEIDWTDNYDWNKGMGFYIPGSGTISDDDGIYLQLCGGAKSFMMDASWKFKLSAKYDVQKSEWIDIKWYLNGTTEYTPKNNTPDNESR